MIYKYELKKILGNKLNLFAMLIGYLIIAVTTIYPIYTESVYIYSSDTTHKGMDAIYYNQKFASSQAEYLTEEYLTEVLKHLQSEKLDLKSDTGFLTASDELGNLFPYLVNSYSDINELNFWPNQLNELDLSDGAKF